MKSYRLTLQMEEIGMSKKKQNNLRNLPKGFFTKSKSIKNQFITGKMEESGEMVLLMCTKKMTKLVSSAHSLTNCLWIPLNPSPEIPDNYIVLRSSTETLH